MTKTELQAALDRANADRLAERKRVVKVALETAKEYRWCGVVQETLRKAGLGDLLPPVYVIQEKRTTRANWRDYVDYEAYEQTELDDAKEAVVELNENCGDGNIYIGHIPKTAADIDQAINELVSTRNLLTNRKGIRYPQYRLVKRSDADEVVDL